MHLVANMPRKSRNAGNSPGEPNRPAKVFTVKVAKDLVATAKKVAVLMDLSVEDYITPVLARCAEFVNEEIEIAGIRGVRDRAEAITDFTERGGFSTFNTTEDVSTRLTSLAGQCLTSVAKLIDPYLRKRIEQDFSHLRVWIAAADPDNKKPEAARRYASLMFTAFWENADLFGDIAEELARERGITYGEAFDLCMGLYRASFQKIQHTLITGLVRELKRQREAGSPMPGESSARPQPATDSSPSPSANETGKAPTAADFIAEAKAEQAQREQSQKFRDDIRKKGRKPRPKKAD